MTYFRKKPSKMRYWENVENPGTMVQAPVNDDSASSGMQRKKYAKPGRKAKGERMWKSKNQGRLIVRNLSFQATENDMKEHFSKFGPVEDVKLLHKPDGRSVGCGFVQFEMVKDAREALRICSGKEFKGRVIVVDWAMPKDKYVKARPPVLSSSSEKKGEGREKVKKNNEFVKEERLESVNKGKCNKKVRKDNEFEKEESTESELQSSEDSDEDTSTFQSDKKKSHHLSENHRKESDSEATETDSDATENDNEAMESDNEAVESDSDEETDEKPKRNKNVKRFDKKDQGSSDFRSNESSVFLKKVPFNVTSEELKEFMQQFGEVVYALLCLDPATEHPKGTAFVKFKRKESADKCLRADSDCLLLNNRQMEACKVITREEIDNNRKKEKNKVKTPKDKRNLYLLGEGVIRPSSKAALDISPSDMGKRLQLEKWKKQMIKNLSVFVAKDRLFVHNLPLEMNSKQLKALFLKHGGKGAKVTEARVMLDMKNECVSKGYGFVSFTKHENALQALRNLNNNPEIFTRGKRPIVAFSLENKLLIEVKKRRLEKNHQRRMDDAADANTKEGKRSLMEKRTPDQGAMQGHKELPEFAGHAAQKGAPTYKRIDVNKLMKMHVKNLRKQKRDMEVQKTRQGKRKKLRAVPESNKKVAKDDDVGELNRYVEKYRQMIGDSTKMKKWYE